VVGDRRQPAAGVDEDRHAALGGDREDGRETVVVEQELLRARMELDAAGAAVEAALCLLDRALGQVEADKRNQSPLGALRVLERAVVGRAKSWMPVWLVHAEHEAARDACRVVDALQLLVDADIAVDVVSKMDVSVEDLRALGQLLPKLFVVARDELLGALKLLLHQCQSMYAR
jgi:type II secretory pathway component PulL